MEILKFQAVVDESSWHNLVQSGKLPTNFNPLNIEWKLGESFESNGELIIPVYAVGYKVIPSENRLSDEEFQQALERLSSECLSDLCAESIHTDCQNCPCLEIPPSHIPDWTPILHK